jgi:TonB family protein
LIPQAEADYDLATVASIVPPGFGRVFVCQTGQGVQGSEKVNHNPLPAGNYRRAGLYRVAVFTIGLLLGLVAAFGSCPAFAQDGRKAKFSIQPAYPELARKNNIQGSARLQVVVAADGNIKDIKVLGGSPVLVQAAVDAVKKWKYETAAAESTVILKFDFKP